MRYVAPILGALYIAWLIASVVVPAILEKRHRTQWRKRLVVLDADVELRKRELPDTPYIDPYYPTPGQNRAMQACFRAHNELRWATMTRDEHLEGRP